MLKFQTNTAIQQIFWARLNLKTHTYKIFTGTYFYLFMYFGNTMLTLLLKNALFGFSFKKNIFLLQKICSSFFQKVKKTL